VQRAEIAEVLARRGNLQEAEKYAQIAVENDADQAEYVAIYADVLSQKPERAQGGNFADVIKMVNDARRAQPDNLKVRRLCTNSSNVGMVLLLHGRLPSELTVHPDVPVDSHVPCVASSTANCGSGTLGNSTSMP